MDILGYLLGSVLLLSPLISAEVEKKGTCIEQAECCETEHTAAIGGKSITYKAIVGSFLLTNDECNPSANLFFTSYVKKDADRKRPITFCFNGGPGSSSVWLHLGFAGPKKIRLEGQKKEAPPYELEDNAYSLLDITDLVFIDPVSTGYSRAIPLDKAKEFHTFDKDVASFAECIRLYLTKFNRWESPKFLMGESYGTTRAVGLASHLHTKEMIELNGIILISSVLNFQTIDFQNGNDLPYLTSLPTYTASAFYHQKLSPELQKNLSDALKQAADFSNEYASALFQGDLLPPEKRSIICQKLSYLTGLCADYIDKNNLRIDLFQFAKELLRKEAKTIGIYDTSITGIDQNPLGLHPEYEPSLFALAGAFTACLNSYMQNDLKWETTKPYKILTNVFPWDYGCSNQYLNVSDNLRDTMRENRQLQVFVASGYLDLVTPFSATDYTFRHLNLDPSLKNHITMKNYDGGHMMYLNPQTLIKLKEDLLQFYQKSLLP